MSNPDRIAIAALVAFLPFFLHAPAQGQYRNYSLRCLAPLIENIDADAPANLQEAFLSGPKQFATRQEGIGAEAIEFPISTNSEEARQLFAQGVALLHLLSYREAERAFRTVVALDPDCPMGYWGLAQANERSPARARIFAEAAQERCDRNHPQIEQRWTALLADFYGEETGGTSDLAGRSARRVRALEEMVLDFPEHLELRAFLIRRLALDQYLAGRPLTSTLAVDTLALDFAKRSPAHPSRHYRVFLWLGHRPREVLDESLAMTALTPQAPEIWRYAAEAHRAAGLAPEASRLLAHALEVEQQNALDHALMPWETENLPGNEKDYIDLLASSGEIEAALAVASSAISRPRDLRSGGNGAEVLRVEALMTAGLWEQLLHELGNETMLRAAPAKKDAAARLSWTGLAHLALGEKEKADEAAAALAALEREAILAGISGAEEQDIARSRKTLDHLRKYLAASAADRAASTLDELDLSPLIRVRFYEVAGDRGRAFRTLSDDYHNGPPDRWLTTAEYSRLALETGHLREALYPINRKFRTGADRADPELPVLAALSRQAETLQLPQTWTLPSSPPDAGFPPAPETTPTWHAPPAPDFELFDRFEKPTSLKQFSGRPLLLTFFLGTRCAFCLEQFDVFQPHYPAFQKEGIEFAAISIESPAELKEMLGGDDEIHPAFRDRFPFPVLADPELETFRRYGVFDDFESGPMHATILISPQGKILWRDVDHTTFREPVRLLEESKRLLRIHEAEPNAES